MDKRHFDQLVKGVREMKRHLVGKSVRGARTTSINEPDSEPFGRQLGAGSHTADRSGTSAVEDRGFRSEVRDRSFARI